MDDPSGARAQGLFITTTGGLDVTTAIKTIQRAEPKGGVNGFIRRLGAVLAALSERIAASSAAYYESGIADDLERVQPSERIDAALRWHARQRRIV